jgi:copper chaperone CopZ
MKTVTIALSSLALCLLAAPAYAQETAEPAPMDHSTMDHSAHADAVRPATATQEEATPAASGEIVTARINGLVCDFCAQSIRKVFGKQAAVETVKVDLDNGEVVLGMKKGQTLDDETVGELIRKSGYALVEIKRAGGA